jgi:hypothetical protein
MITIYGRFNDMFLNYSDTFSLKDKVVDSGYYSPQNDTWPNKEKDWPKVEFDR